MCSRGSKGRKRTTRVGSGQNLKGRSRSKTRLDERRWKGRRKKERKDRREREEKRKNWRNGSFKLEEWFLQRNIGGKPQFEKSRVFLNQIG